MYKTLYNIKNSKYHIYTTNHYTTPHLSTTQLSPTHHRNSQSLLSRKRRVFFNRALAPRGPSGARALPPLLANCVAPHIHIASRFVEPAPPLLSFLFSVRRALVPAAKHNADECVQRPLHAASPISTLRGCKERMASCPGCGWGLGGLRVRR